MMTISRSRKYIASNPCFALTLASCPRLQRGQMTIVYSCLEPFGSSHTLEDLVRTCLARDYQSSFKNPNTDIRKSILYHLDRMQKSGAVRECP